MNHEDFREALEELEISQLSFARLVGIDPRTCRRYALGESEIPRIIDLFLHFAMYKPRAFKELVKARELLDDEL